MTYKLMIKTHNKTGLKYLCKTVRNPYTYHGSGLYWKRHLKMHGIDINTEVIFVTESGESLKEKGIFYSKLFNIVEDPGWANLRFEEGDGGNTVSNKFWITNGIKDEYNEIGCDIPLGWKKGRSTGAFSNREMQKELSSRVDRKKAGESIKRAWAEGRFIRDHSKCGVRGENSSSKREDEIGRAHV